MGVFNFSNMQDTNEQSKENLYIPVEFRQDNNNAASDNKYTGTNNEKAASNNGYLPGGSNGFIDETGTWNDGSSLYQYKTTDTQWNQSIDGQLMNSNAYKKYFYNREDVLQEAKTMAGALKIPENAILKDANTLAKTREIYNYQQRQLDKDGVFKAYPELASIAKKSDTDAAIALHNLKNIKETRDIFEAMKVGLELDELNSTRGRIGFKGMNGAELTEEDYKKIDEIDKRMAELPKLPGLLESPLAAIAGGTAQTGRLMLRNFFNGQKMGAYGAGFGAILGAVGAGSATLGTGAAAGAIAGARLGYSIGSRIGMAQDMYDEVAGNNYLDFKKYKDKNGRQLLTDNQARVYGAAAAAIETAIEYSNADKILDVIKGTGSESTIREIIKAAKNNTELYSMLTAFVKKGIVNTGKVAVPETIEEGVQEASNRIITNVMALNNPGGDIPAYSTEDILAGAVESMWAALPASIGLGAAAQGASTMRMGRQIAKVLSLKSEQDKANYKNANGLSMLRQLKEYMANSELNKKNPELQKEVLTQQLADSGMETLAVDTDMVLNQQGGYELLKEVADKAGISEEVFNQIVETRSDMTISTAVYAQTILPDEIAAKLEDYITFDAAGECLARNRQYAGRIRRLADELIDTESQRRMETLTTFLDSNFRNDQEREVAEAVLMRYPDNPAEGVKALRKQIQGQIDAMLEPVLARMQEGMGNGVSIIYVDDDGNPTTEEYAARGIRASNNEGWYSEFYKDYGRAPTKQEMKDIARDILTGKSSYQVAGWEYQNGAEEYYEQNREHLEKLDESIERLNALTPRLEKIDPGELTITEGLSKEGYEVYKMTAEKLLSSASKQSRAAARMSAILYARMADRMAELYREAGYKKYTALDFAKRITLDITGQGSNGSVFNQWSTDNDIIIGDKQEFDKQISEIKNKYVNTPQWMKAPNGEPTKLTEQQWLAVRTPAFIEKYGDWVTLHKNKLKLIKWTQNYEGLKQIVSKIRDKDLFNASTGISAKLSKKGKNKIISGMARRLSELNGYTDDEHYTVVANMEQLFESAILSEHQQDKYGEIAGIDLYSSYCEINNKPAVAIFTVKETNNAGKTLYTVQLTEIKKPTGTLPRLVKKRSSATVGFSDINITQLAKKFKNIRSYIGENGEPDLSKLAGISLEQRDYNAIKQAQLDIINQNNAMQDNYHTGIRTIDDILSADEALNVTQEALDNYEVEAYSYPDFSLKDGKRALKTGRIRVYSSKPITPGAFITPSKMMAQDYAGDGKVYSKVIPLEDMAFINGDEGQYAPVSSSFNQKGTDLDSVYIGNQYTMQRPAQEVLGAYNELINHEEIDLSDTVIEGSDIKEKRKRAKELCNRIYEKDGVKEPIQDKYGQEILVVRGTGTEILKHSANEDILALIPNFKKIIPNAVLLYDSEPIPTRVKHMMDYVDYYKTYGTMVKINNTSYFVKLLVRVQKNGQVILHDADLSKIEKTKAEPKGPSDATYDVALMPKGSTFVENSIPWWINEVKTKLISVNNLQQNEKVVGLKGQTTIKANGERVISLFKAADQSTFMHEAAHLYLSEMIALAKTPNAPAQLHKDLQTIASWANWNEGQISEYVGTYLEKEFTQLNSEIKEAMAKGSAIHNGQEMSLEQLKTIWMQERFARGFENYLKQGKAPTAAIQSVFSKFKAWLSNIYRSFKQLGGAPTKEVRAVMDRMIATQDEVEIEMKKRGVNYFVKNGGMDYLAEDSQALYNRMIARAKEEAESKVLKVAMKDIREDYQKQQQEYLAQAEADYREELSTEPVFRVQEHMKNNPGLSTSAVCQSLGLTLQEYIAKLDEYGGNIDAAVETYMKQLRVDVENTPIDEADLRTKAEEAVQGSYYRKMVTALELNAFENIAKAQRTLNRKIAKDLGEVDAKEAAEAMKKLTAKEKMEAGLRAVRDVAEGHYRDYVEYVKSKLETMPISDANNYKMWRRKSAEALDMANHAMTKGNWEQAVNCKKQQLIYDLFADEAVKNAKYVDKLEQTLARRQVTMSNNLNMPANERYVYNHLLYAFGFVKKDAAEPPGYKSFTETLMKRDETLECPFVGENGTLDLPDWILSAGSGTQARAAGHRDLTMQQLKDLAQLMKVIYKTGMEADKLRTAKDVHGNTVGLRDAIRQIAREAEQRVLLKNDKDTTGAQGKTKLEQALDAANAAHVALLKPETIFRQLGESAMRYIYNPLKAAADKELKLSGEMQKDLTKLFSVYSKEEMHEMRTEKKYRLGTSLLTKERLIMLGVNWGTYISQQRVMAGHNLSSYEVIEVLSNLDKRDWELITGIWALYEKHWPELQAVEARLTGAVLEKQEAFPFTILGKDGTKYNIPGGYFPLKYDPTKNAKVKERTDDIAKKATMAGFALGIGRSMTKERSQGNVALKLDLRFDVISKTLADEIHLISFREPVRDARRIIINEDFQAVINNIYGQNTVEMLRKWSADCWALEPVPQNRFERVMSMLRGNMTMAVLGYRTMTAILNVLNITPMAHYLGGPAEAMRAMKRFYARPKEMYAYITQESVFMAERAMTMDINIREAIQKGTTADMLPGYKAVQENAFRLIALTDLSIAMPLWLREYEKTYQNALDNGLKPESAKRDAVLAGDAAVRRVFGSSQKIDLSAVHRGSEIMKCMTMYYSYFSTLYNALAYMTYETRQKVMGAKIRSGSWKKAVAENKKQLLKGLAPLANGLLMWILIPSVMGALLSTIADDDKDKWSIDKLMLKTGKNIVSNLVGGIPLLRDAVPYLMARAFGEPQYSMGTLPAYNTVEQLNKVIQSIASDKKTIYDVARESLRLTGTFAGFSTTLSDGLATTIEWAGTDFEASVPEYLRAVIFDRKLKKK